MSRSTPNTRSQGVVRSRRRFAGVTAAVAGSAALVAVPALVGGVSIASSPTAKEAPGHQIAFQADPQGMGHEVLPDPPKPVAEPAPQPPAPGGTERASRSTSRAALPTPKDAGSSRSGSATTSGSPKTIARAQLAERGWSGQFSCLNSLWEKESGWQVSADNPSSSAYGIPQALPGSKMATAGSDWRTNPATQIQWGLDYIDSTYGTPCAAWSQSKSNNWY